MQMRNNQKTEITTASRDQWLREHGGIINVNKPAGLTSHDVVGRLRRLLSVRKVGHTGTLDPMATGVLPICVGRATRIMEYLDMDRKTYRCTMRLGRTYDTQDVTGTVLSEAEEARIDLIREEDVRKAFSVFQGVIWQLPPMYSARKVDGRKLYEYARNGQGDQILEKVKPRQIYIWDLTIDDLSLGKGYDSEIVFSVTCSKGTYIRTICQEAGERLGVGGAMASLVRNGTGGFVLEEAVDLAQLEEMSPEEICAIMKAPEEALTAFGRVHLSGPLDIRRITTGLPVWTKHIQIVEEPAFKTEVFPLPIREEFRRTYLAYAVPEDVFLGIVTMDEDGENIRADKIFADGTGILAGREGDRK